MIGVLDIPRIVDVPVVAEPMKLSEAMKQGAKLRGQAIAHYYNSEDETTCALGAAYEAGLMTIGNTDVEMLMTCDSHALVEMYPVLRSDQSNYPHPISGRVMHLYSVIISLNDDYGWTREDIASWLEGEGL